MNRLIRNAMLTSHMMGLTSRALPPSVLMNAKLIKPKAKPLAMDDVSGIMMMVRNAGSASVKSSKFTLPTSLIIRAPTRISDGAVAYPGTRPISGANSSETKNIFSVDIQGAVTAIAIGNEDIGTAWDKFIEDNAGMWKPLEAELNEAYGK